jgi:hypothetical protein
MPENNNFLKTPNDDQVVWRYMSLSKFISMISKKELYFASLKQLAKADKFEGLSPIPNFLRTSNIPGLEGWNKQQLEIAEYQQTLTREFIENGRIFINCWHMNTHECFAMWKIYSDSEGGVAIKTTFKNLMDSFDQFLIQAGIINYYPVERKSLVFPDDFLYFATEKPDEYIYEKELRLFYLPTSSDIQESSCHTQKGYSIKVDLTKLIQEVVISPISKPMFREVIESLLQKYELLDCIINNSRLA